MIADKKFWQVTQQLINLVIMGNLGKEVICKSKSFKENRKTHFKEEMAT